MGSFITSPIFAMKFINVFGKFNTMADLFISSPIKLTSSLVERGVSSAILYIPDLILVSKILLIMK